MPSRATTAAAVAVACGLAGCGGDDAATVELVVTAPQGADELLPGGALDVAWTLTGPAEIVVTLTALNATDARVVFDDDAPAGAAGFAWDGRDVDGALLPPAVYDLEVAAFVDGDPVGAAVRSVAVHGVIVSDPAVGETRVARGSDGQVDFHMITVSHRVIGLVTSFDPDVTVDGDELGIDDRTIPGEFVPFERPIHFDGVDLDGAPVPAGTYTLVIDAADADTALAYRAVGGTVDWRPAE